MNLAGFTRFILAGFRTPELWNMPETRAMAMPQVFRKKMAKPQKALAFPRPFFSRDFTILGLMLLATAIPSRALACAACFGQSDSDMAHGLNAGILFLFVIVAGVLGAFAAFFIYLAKRARSASALAQSEASFADSPDHSEHELLPAEGWQTTR